MSTPEGLRAGEAALDYPVCLRLAGRRVLVVGGGAVARGRVDGLRAAGARIDLIAPRVDDELAALARAGAITVIRRPWRPDDLVGATIVVVAIDDRAISARIAAAARARGVPCTVADQPALCDFTMPSVGRRGPITVAVSTGGLAPALAARLRRRLEAAIGDDDIAIAHGSAAVRRALPAGRHRMAVVRRLVGLATSFTGGVRRLAGGAG